MSLIDPIGLQAQAHHPLDQEFLRRIARFPTELPREALFFILAENLRRQDHQVGPAAMIEGVDSRPILALVGARAGAFLIALLVDENSRCAASTSIPIRRTRRSAASAG
jgi:hypothetical protein